MTKRIIGAYVEVVILNVPSWLCGVLCYCGYKPARAQQAPLWGGVLKAGLQCSTEAGGGTWELCSFKYSKFSKLLQTAAFIIIL